MEFDPASSTAKRANELARELVSGRLSNDPDLWGQAATRVVNDLLDQRPDTREEAIQQLAYLALALSGLAMAGIQTAVSWAAKAEGVPKDDIRDDTVGIVFGAFRARGEESGLWL